MNNAGFYKKENTQILFAPNIVEGPGYVLLVDDKDRYIFPVDGWIYADSLDDAIKQFADSAGANNSPNFIVQPENIELSTSRYDELEFSKLIVLINLNMQQNKIMPNTLIPIWDCNKQQHQITAQRFLEVMAEYGMHCYMQRN